MYFGKPALNVSEMIENENINDLSLTIYYLSPYALMFYPVSSVEESDSLENDHLDVQSAKALSATL